MYIFRGFLCVFFFFGGGGGGGWGGVYSTVQHNIMQYIFGSVLCTHTHARARARTHTHTHTHKSTDQYVAFVLLCITQEKCYGERES